MRARGNLEVLTRALATRVLFSGTRATGVEYLRGARAKACRRAPRCSCAAARSTPRSCLELSGVGSAPLLGQYGIAVVADSPAVGEGLQDHLAVSYFYRSRVPTLNNQLAPLLGKVRAALRYAVDRRGPLAMSVNQAGAFIRSRPGLAAPNLHIYFNPASYSTTTLGSKRRLLNPDPYPGFLMSFNTCRPGSRGSSHIRSPDPEVAPCIAPISLATAVDVQDVFDGARLVRKIAAAGPLSAVTEYEREPGLKVMSDAERAGGLPRPRRHRVPRLRHLRDGGRSAHRGARCAAARTRRHRPARGGRLGLPQRDLGQHQRTHDDAGGEGGRPDCAGQPHVTGVPCLTMPRTTA